MKSQVKSTSIKMLAMGAVLTALVIILQFMGAFVRLGMFQISLVLIPIVIGAALCGPFMGAWLGFVFGMVVLLNGDAAPFLAVNAIGTIITVLVKGTLCGLIAGYAYKLFAKWNATVGTFAAAFVCPIVNTGVFLLGCVLFFMPTITEWAAGAGYGSDAVAYMFLGLAGGNFLFELLFNLVLSPVIVRLLKISKKFA